MNCDFLKKMLSSKSGISSSRIFALVTLNVTFLMSICSLIAIVKSDITVAEVQIIQSIFSTLSTIFIACISGSTISKFSEKNTQGSEQNEKPKKDM